MKLTPAQLKWMQGPVSPRTAVRGGFLSPSVERMLLDLVSKGYAATVTEYDEGRFLQFVPTGLGLAQMVKQTNGG